MLPSTGISNLPEHLNTVLADVDDTGQKRRRITNIIPITQSSAQATNLTPHAPPIVDDDEHPGDWDYLLEKYGTIEDRIADQEQAHNQISSGLPSPEETFLDEDLQSQLSLHAQGDAQSDAEDPGPLDPVQTSSKTLSETRKVDIINEAIANYTERWNARDLPKSQQAARSVWLKAESEGERDWKMIESSGNTKLIQNHLDRMCEEILHVNYRSEDRFRKQCEILQVTVENLQQAKFDHSIYAQDTEPEHVDVIMSNATYFKDNDSEEDEDEDEESIIEGSPTQDDVDFIDDTPHPVREVIHLDSSSDEDGPEHMEIDDERLRPNQNQNSQRPVVTASVEAHPTAPLVWPALDEISSQPQERGRLDDRPEEASFVTVSGWDWNNLVDSQDRKRIVLKVLREMTEEERDIIRVRLQIRRQGLLNELAACTRMMSNKSQRMPGVMPDDTFKVVMWTKLFLSWWLGDNYMKKQPDQEQLRELLACLRTSMRDPEIFHGWVVHAMENTFRKGSYNWKAGPPPAAVIIDLTLD